MIDDTERQCAALRALTERQLSAAFYPPDYPSKGKPAQWYVHDQRYVDGRPGHGWGPTLADAIDAYKPAGKAGKRKRAVEQDELDLEDA